MKKQLKLKSLISIVLLIICFLMIEPQPINAQAQSPGIKKQINIELKRRGLEENEVRTRLLQKGIDLENIPPAELPNYQTRVIAILDEMEAEKKAVTSLKQTEATPDTLKIAKPKIIEPEITKSVITEPITTKEEAVSEAAQRVVQAAAAKEEGVKAIYGHSLFTDQTLKVFRTTEGALAPDTYILGAGDEIRITIFGASQTDMQFKINSKGYIQPTGMPKIFLQGLSLLQARDLLLKRLSASFTFRPDQFALTIATARTILVNVFGETKITGGFTISALNSAFNALSAAGGPTDIGSVRNIQLIRGEKRKTLDLYSFMKNPAIQFKFDLQQNDIIYVPVVQKLVTINGAVKRPMRYEMLSKETLFDLISYAGGVKMDVYPNFVQIQRFVDGEIRLLEWNLNDVLSKKIKVPLENGDVVLIKSIKKPIEQYVEIDGSVYYPGRYDLVANDSLSRLLINAQLTTQAKTDLIFIERIRPNETTEVLTIPWSELQNSKKDFLLQARDRVHISALANYRDVGAITVTGNVRAPFKKIFSLKDRLTVKQALELAQGVKPSVYPIAYIFRTNLFNPAKIEYIRVEMKNADNIFLQPGDKLNVYDNSQFVNVGAVRVFGAVKKSMEFTFDPSLKIQDVLTAAGGFTVGAAQNRIEVFRTILSPTEKARLKMITVEVDSNYQVIKPNNFNLQPYDQIVVRLTPDFTLGRLVEISGEVKYPGKYVLKSDQTHLSEVINMAGGLLEDADAKGSRLFRTFNNRGNITMDIDKAIHNHGDIRFDPILFEGDVINIERRENTVAIRQYGTRLADYPSPFANNEIINIVYQGDKSARWYIKNYAGGFDPNADKNSVTVSLKNGQVKSTKKILFVFRKYPKVETGSIISMKMKPPKEKKDKNKEKTDWQGIWSSTLSAVTTALTILVLSKQL